MKILENLRKYGKIIIIGVISHIWDLMFFLIFMIFNVLKNALSQKKSKKLNNAIAKRRCSIFLAIINISLIIFTPILTGIEYGFFTVMLIYSRIWGYISYKWDIYNKINRNLEMLIKEKQMARYMLHLPEDESLKLCGVLMVILILLILIISRCVKNFFISILEIENFKKNDE